MEKEEEDEEDICEEEYKYEYEDEDKEENKDRFKYEDIYGDYESSDEDICKDNKKPIKLKGLKHKKYKQIYNINKLFFKIF